MKSLIKLYKFIETLEDEEDDEYFDSIKSEIKQKIFDETILKYDDEKKKQEEEFEEKIKIENKKKEEREKYMKLQKEREEEGEVCPRCSRRDCCC